jgi:hypothetical protein
MSYLPVIAVAGVVVIILVAVVFLKRQ